MKEKEIKDGGMDVWLWHRYANLWARRLTVGDHSRNPSPLFSQPSCPCSRGWKMDTKKKSWEREQALAPRAHITWVARRTSAWVNKQKQNNV